MQFPSISDWLAGSFLNPDWFRKLARPILVTNRLSRQLTSSPYYSMQKSSSYHISVTILWYATNLPRKANLKNDLDLDHLSRTINK